MGRTGSAAPGARDERSQYARNQAAARGDQEARDAIVAEARPALIRRLQRELDVAPSAAEQAMVPIIEEACRLAFDSIGEKPANWSMYGWLAWHVEREAHAGARSLLPT